MDGSQWIGLFRRIPESQHDCLILATGTGTELVIKRIVSLERDFILVVGRLGGSTDHPKPILIPYDQLTYVSISKQLDEAGLQSLLDGPPSNFGDRAQNNGRPDSRAAMNLPAPTVENRATDARPSFVGLGDPGQRLAEAAADQATVQSSSRTAPPSKSILLARLRQRLADDATRKTGT